MDWSEFYPALTSEELTNMRVRIADVGCGFGGLTGTHPIPPPRYDYFIIL
jgi:hypothetical protein